MIYDKLSDILGVHMKDTEGNATKVLKHLDAAGQINQRVLLDAIAMIVDDLRAKERLEEEAKVLKEYAKKPKKKKK